MGESSETTTLNLIHEEGDHLLYTSALSIDGEEDILNPSSDIDDKFAERLQLQEVLLSSVQMAWLYSQGRAGVQSLVFSTHQGEGVQTLYQGVDQNDTINSTASGEDPDDHDPKGKRAIDAPQPSIAQCSSDSGEDPDDAKRKRPIEVGQSSNDPLIMREAYCGICMESKPLNEFFDINKSCSGSHSFCESCVSQYVAAKLEENVTAIGCPDPGCKDVLLEPEMCRPILTPQVFDRWCSALCESMIEAKFYCPYKDCSAMMMGEVDSGGEVIRESECPHCHRLFCAQCRVPWHGEMGCKEFQVLDEGEKESEDLMLRRMATSCSWQRCPKCGFYIERIDGCIFMQCRCGNGFCYRCGSSMVEHYCNKCQV